jgi:hypothetical protein
MGQDKVCQLPKNIHYISSDPCEHLGLEASKSSLSQVQLKIEAACVDL